MDALCVGDLKAVSAGLALAASNAFSQACVSGSGEAEAFQTSFVSSATTVMASAIATATGQICAGEHGSNSECGVDVSGSSSPGSSDQESSADTNTSATPGSNGGSSEGSSVLSLSASGNQLEGCSSAIHNQCCWDASSCDVNGLFKIQASDSSHQLIFTQQSQNPDCFCY
ncbi:hypothetical protein BSKO_13311 [Bryopsis sp. KO-2023]|nr:hypothetical protein BSKO_13311 [Bryopsis sp. KO-2023]